MYFENGKNHKSVSFKKDTLFLVVQGVDGKLSPEPVALFENAEDAFEYVQAMNAKEKSAQE